MKRTRAVTESEKIKANATSRKTSSRRAISHRMSEQRRREKVNRLMNTLKELIPLTNENSKLKVDKATILRSAIGKEIKLCQFLYIAITPDYTDTSIDFVDV